MKAGRGYRRAVIEPTEQETAMREDSRGVRMDAAHAGPAPDAGLRSVHADIAQHLLDLERDLGRRSDPRVVALARERHTQAKPTR